MSVYQGDQKVANNITIENTSYSVPIGTIISYASTTLPTGFLLCDGSEISKTDYTDLYAVIGNKFGTATDTTKFKLPDLRDKFIQGANDNLGASKKAGLPNITGSTGDSYIYTNDSNKAAVMGAFDCSTIVASSIKGDTESKTISSLQFNASKSNSIYGNSDTVQPPAVCLHYIIKASKVSDQSSDIIDDTANTTDKTWSASKISTELSIFPFKWEQIGTSSPDTSDESSNTFSQTMSGGNPFCVYHSSGVFCFGNGINKGKLFGMTSGSVATVTYTETGLLTVSVGQGTAYIYQMKTIN